MGYRQAAVLSSACFLLGILFVCFNVDRRLLFQDVNDEAVEDGFQFYTTFYNAPPAIRTLLHTMVGVGLVGLFGKLHRWDESAMFFDGTCIAGYVLSIAMYISVTIPTLRVVVDPLPDIDTREDRIQAMRVLGAGNTIVAIILGAVLCLQAGDEYARRYEARELAKLEASQNVETAQVPVVTSSAASISPAEKKAQ